jgi:hypothetical protein
MLEQKFGKLKNASKAINSAAVINKLPMMIYVVICLTVGVFLTYLPWTDYWRENFFLHYLAAWLRWPQLIDWAQTGYIQGAVTGLGVINVVLGLWEANNLDRLADAEALAALEAMKETNVTAKSPLSDK